jgi:hypothetical protein
VLADTTLLSLQDVELAIQDSEESPVGGTPKSPVMRPGGYTAAMNDAKTAYKKGDAQASASAHAKKLENEEEHSKAGDHIKSVVFGGLDGIITTFSVVAGASGGSLSVGVILILGFSNLFSDGTLVFYFCCRCFKWFLYPFCLP